MHGNNNYYMVFILRVILLIYMAQSSFAAIFPKGCEKTGFGYNGPLLTFNHANEQAYFLIHNRSYQPIKLKHVETTDVFMSPSLTAYLKPNYWAAFASDMPEQLFQCVVIEEKIPKQVNCRDVLDVCQYPRVKFALSNMGNYWVAVNKAQRQVIQESTKKGIFLKW
tara:strand:+ start:3147 stop:3644 length:498 start_codon:yes stop_codon:yes gene_type:complete